MDQYQCRYQTSTIFSITDLETLVTSWVKIKLAINDRYGALKRIGKLKKPFEQI